MRAFAIETALLLGLAFAIGLAIGLYLRARRAAPTGTPTGADRRADVPPQAPAGDPAAPPPAAPVPAGLAAAEIPAAEPAQEEPTAEQDARLSATPASANEAPPPAEAQGELHLGGTPPPASPDQAKGAGSARGPAKAGGKGKAEADHPGRRPPAVAPPEAGCDDLKLIKGIGPQNEARLHALGIHQLRQIAAWSAEEALWVGSYLAFPGRIEREDWIGQARALIAGTRPEDLRLPPRRPQ
ncbi:hypothetical protein [Xanthobacter sp. KR7-225]|uniref:hypothetical protein n=1 Tax=Xanthobacter sp. KR7-225 TaxID=3156613 RepID=UPI0032B6163C